MKKVHYRQNFYYPINPEKYLLDTNKYPIVYRSSWEKHFFKFLDMNENVIAWASEPVAIPYMKPIIGKNNKPGFRKAKYYPDVYVEYKDKDGNMKREMIEIKPLKQLRPSRSKKTQRRLQENYVYSVNKSKWAAAEKWCQKQQIEFKIMTEKSIFK